MEMFYQFFAMVIPPVSTIQVYILIYVVKIHGRNFLKLDWNKCHYVEEIVQPPVKIYPSFSVDVTFSVSEPIFFSV